jgi:hypothetical protein
LKQKGVIGSEASFDSWWSGVGNDLTALISDSDNDGYLDLDANQLYGLLEDKGVMKKDKTAFNFALATVTNRFFKDDAAADPAVAGPGGAGAPGTMSPGEFESYVRETYNGKLCGNPELQAAFTRDLESFLAGHFTGAFDGEQVDVNDQFVWSPNSDRSLSAAGSQRRGDCGVYADASAHYMRAAGLKVVYYGSYINTGNASGGHVQAVGYLTGGGFLLVSNNAHLTASDQTYSARNAGTLVRQSLTASQSEGGFGSGTQVYQIFPGVRSAAAVVTMQQQAIARNASLSSLQDAVNAYSRYEGGLHFIAESSLEEVGARAGQARTRTPALRDKMAWGDTNEALAGNLLKKVYLPQLNKMAKALDALAFLSEHLQGSDFPLSISVDNGESSSMLTFNNKAQLDGYIAEQQLFVDQARISIDEHLTALDY